MCKFYSHFTFWLIKTKKKKKTENNLQPKVLFCFFIFEIGFFQMQLFISKNTKTYTRTIIFYYLQEEKTKQKEITSYSRIFFFFNFTFTKIDPY